MAYNEQIDSIRIPSFQSGINEYSAEGLIKPYEAVKAYNCNISEGSLRTFNAPDTKYTTAVAIQSISPYYGTDKSLIIFNAGSSVYSIDSWSATNQKLCSINYDNIDYINFEYMGKRVLVGVGADNVPFMYDGTTCRQLKNRRPFYDENTGELKGYIDDNGKEHKTEDTISTYCPKGKFLELHYDRLWIAGNNTFPDRVYFSTAGVNGADIEDFTIPVADEVEANMHGGFIDVRTYDGSKIIGMKTIFNSVVIFKEKSAHKVYGSSPSNYQMVDLFSCNGAIADKSIVVGNNGAYFLNRDGIYYYDGTNTNLVSYKIKNTISKMNINYANQAVGIFANSKYYLAIPTGESTLNNTLIEFDTINNSFMVYEVGNISNFMEYNHEVYYSDYTKICKLFGTGKPKYLYWESPMMDLGSKNARKMSNYIYFRAKGNGKIKFTLKTEKKDKSLEVELTDTETLYRKKLKNKGRMFKLIIENVDNSSFELIAPEIMLEVAED